MKVMKYLYLPLIVATRDGPKMSQWMSSPGRVARIFDRLSFGTGRLLIFPYRHASHVSGGPARQHTADTASINVGHVGLALDSKLGMYP